MPIRTFVSERRAANLLAQIRWRNGVYCPRCRAESVIRPAAIGCFNDIAVRIRSRWRPHIQRSDRHRLRTLVVALRKWFLAVYTYIPFNTSLSQLDVELDVSYKTVYRRVQRS